MDHAANTNAAIERNFASCGNGRPPRPDRPMPEDDPAPDTLPEPLPDPAPVPEQDPQPGEVIPPILSWSGEWTSTEV